MVGDMDNTGSLNAQVIHQLTSAVRSKIAIQVCRVSPDIQLCNHNRYGRLYIFVNIIIVSFPIIFKTQQHKFVNWQCDMEYRGADFTTAVTLGNPDVLLGSGWCNSKIQRTHLTLWLVL